MIQQITRNAFRRPYMLLTPLSNFADKGDEESA